MLFWLTELSDGGDFFNLFRYITFRAGGAFLTALIFGFLFGRPLINVLRKRQGKGQRQGQDSARIRDKSSDRARARPRLGIVRMVGNAPL